MSSLTSFSRNFRRISPTLLTLAMAALIAGFATVSLSA